MWQARQETCEAAAAAEEAGHRDMSAQHHAGSGLAAVKEKAGAVLDALRALAKLALRTSAAMQAASFALQTVSHAASAQVLANPLLQRVMSSSVLGALTILHPVSRLSSCL